MKKIFVSMIMAAAMIAGGSAYAQSVSDGSTGASVQKEKMEKGKKANKENKAKKGVMVEKKAARPQFNPFDGVQLTDDQQQRLQLLQQGLGPVKLTPEQQAKIKENKNLSDAEKKQLKEERKAKQLEKKKNYLKGVKEILTPDQYVIFLENFYINVPQAKAQSMKATRGDKGNKGKYAYKNKRDKRNGTKKA